MFLNRPFHLTQLALCSACLTLGAHALADVPAEDATPVSAATMAYMDDHHHVVIRIASFSQGSTGASVTLTNEVDLPQGLTLLPSHHPHHHHDRFQEDDNPHHLIGQPGMTTFIFECSDEAIQQENADGSIGLQWVAKFDGPIRPNVDKNYQINCKASS